MHLYKAAYIFSWILFIPFKEWVIQPETSRQMFLATQVVFTYASCVFKMAC